MKTSLVIALVCSLLIVCSLTADAAKIKSELRLEKREAERFLKDRPHKIVKRQGGDEAEEETEEVEEERDENEEVSENGS